MSSHWARLFCKSTSHEVVVSEYVWKDESGLMLHLQLGSYFFASLES